MKIYAITVIISVLNGKAAYFYITSIDIKGPVVIGTHCYQASALTFQFETFWYFYGLIICSRCHVHSAAEAYLIDAFLNGGEGPTPCSGV